MHINGEETVSSKDEVNYVEDTTRRLVNKDLEQPTSDTRRRQRV